MMPPRLSPEAGASAAWPPGANPCAIAASVLLATSIEVLDASVAKVALLHIAGSLPVITDAAGAKG
jgi:DHA2 family multidrug resistance protein